MRDKQEIDNFLKSILHVTLHVHENNRYFIVNLDDVPSWHEENVACLNY